MYLFLEIIYLISNISIVLLFSSIFSLILAGFFILKTSIYRLFSLLINYIKRNMAFTLTIKKLIVLYKMLYEIKEFVIFCHTLYIKRYLVISQVISHIFGQCLKFILAILKN